MGKETNKTNKERKPLFSITAKDCRWDYYRASGPGGQKKNKTSSAVRCTHEISGAVGKAEEHRSQSQNKKLAFRRMADSDKFRKWVKVEMSRRMGKEAEIKNLLEKEMRPINLKLETKGDDKKWTEWIDWQKSAELE